MILSAAHRNCPFPFRSFSNLQRIGSFPGKPHGPENVVLLLDSEEGFIAYCFYTKTIMRNSGAQG
jgi:hypothetical protein